MTKSHISNRDMYTFLIEQEGFSEHLPPHLRQCRDCRIRFNRMREFVVSFRTSIDEADTDWKIHKAKILSAVSQTRQPTLKWRLAPVVVASCLVIISALLMTHVYIDKGYRSKIDESGITENMGIVAEDMGKIELPQAILILEEWDGEDFHQFLNFFTPIEEVYDEEKDSVHNNIRNRYRNRFVLV